MRISAHAKKRAKERIGIKPGALDRLSRIAFEKGLTPADTAGKLKDYIDKLYLSQGTADEIRIYGRFVYIFAGTILITVFHLKKDCWKLAESLQRRKVDMDELAESP